MMLAACTGKAPKQGALIEGLATGLDPADKIVAILFHLEGSSGKGLQTDTLRDGHFSIRLDSLSGGNRYQITLIRFDGNRLVNVLNDGPEIYLEPGTYVRIKGEGRYFRNARISSPVKDQQLQQHFVRKMSLEDWKAVQDVSAHRDKVVRETYNIGISPEQRDSLRKLAKEEQDEMDRINERLSQQRLQLLETVKMGQYSLEQLCREARFASFKGRDNRDTLLRLYNRLSDEQKASPEGMEILNYINPVKTLSIGDILPPYEYVDKGGKTVRLDTFRGR